MKNSTGIKCLGRGITTLLTLAIVAAMAMGQHLVIGGGTFTGNGQYNIAGNISSTAPTSISGTVIMDGAVQSITGSAMTFKNLTIAGSNVKNADVNITVQGQLTVNQNLNMDTSNSRVLTMADAAKTTQPAFSAHKEVTGSMKWEAFANQPYKFNNDSTIITFSTADAARTFELKVQPATNPTGYQLATSVNRKIYASYAAWTAGTADIQLAYQNTEVDGSLIQARLKGFNGTIASANKLGGTVSRAPSGVASYGYVKHASLAIAAITSGNEIPLDTRFSPFISTVAANWNVPGTWDANAIPTSSDDVEINTAVSIPDAYAAAALSATINNGAGIGLTVGTGTGGSLAVGAGGLTNNNITGTGLTVATGASVTVTGGTLSNNGAITNDGTIRTQQ